MKNNSLINIRGLKCDNPECNYEDMSIEVKDYKKYINYPCPCCGAPLLTKADYNNVKNLIRFAKLAEILGVKPDGDVFSVKMNGTGSMNIKKR